MKAWWDDKAGQVQQANRLSESQQTEVPEDQVVRRSVINAREDIAGLFVYASAANQQLASIRKALWVIATLLVYIAYMLAAHAL